MSVINYAAANGHFEIVHWAHSITPQRLLPSSSLFLYLDGPLSNGHLEVAKWLHANVSPRIKRDVGRSVEYAAGRGDMETLKWLYRHFPDKFQYFENSMPAAAGNGHLTAIKWLHMRARGCTRYVPFMAAENGHVEVVQWVHEHYPSLFAPCVMDTAAQHGHLDVVQWLLANRFEGCTTDAMTRAARKGHLDVVVWLIGHTTKGFSHEAMQAPRLVEIGYPRGNSTSSSKPEIDASERCLQAVFKLHPEFVKGCLRCLAEIAFEVGHVHILQWLEPFGITLLSDVPIRRAVSAGNLELVKWVHNNFPEMCQRALLQLAIHNGHLRLSRWLVERGYEIGAFVVPLKRLNVTLLHWLLEHGLKLGLSSAAPLALESDYVEVTSWLQECDRVQLVLQALRGQKREVLWWLLMRTRFEEEASRINLCHAVYETMDIMRTWLLANIDDGEVCSWLFEEKAMPVYKTKRARLN